LRFILISLKKNKNSPVVTVLTAGVNWNFNFNNFWKPRTKCMFEKQEKQIAEDGQVGFT